jgi:serine protease inhibitor
LPTTDKLVAANTRFGFKLFSEIAKRDAGKNIFISPFSVAAALAMTYNGASGETQRAMAKTLELNSMSLDEVNQANAELCQMLEGLDPQVQLAIANSLWLKHGETFKPEFIRRGRSFYDAEVANFSSGDAPIINGWVSRKTRDKIKELVTDSDVAMSILMLINAVYFKGNWTAQFDKANTQESTFTLLSGKQKKLPMMSQSGHFTYHEEQGFQAISLPYGEGKVSMYIFLPGHQSSLAKFQQQLTVENWNRWISNLAETPGKIVLPRFKVEYGIGLNEVLRAIGMGIAFDPKADFSEMTSPPAFISKVIHKTFMEVNEEGTEAAAATVVMMGRSLSFNTPFTMIVDRPFFCAIRDNETGTLLFMGSIVDPQ